MATPAPAVAPAAAAQNLQAGNFASASLYVGDLTADVTEAQLYEVFNAVGPVASIRVCRDSMTRRSLGYAYVNYHASADAERALDTLNFQPIKGQPVRIMWSHRDPAMRRGGAGNVFVKNLDKNIDHKALYDTFSLFGNILSCKVAMDEKGHSRGFGFVHYETEEAANTAIERVNGMQIGAKTVYVGKFVRKADRHSGKEDNFTNVYVKNFPAEWSEEKLRGVFDKFGAIQSLATFKDKYDRPFAFLNFEKHEAAKAAVMELNDCVATVQGVKEGSQRQNVDYQELEEQDEEVRANLEGKAFGEALPEEDKEKKEEKGEKKEGEEKKEAAAEKEASGEKKEAGEKKADEKETSKADGEEKKEEKSPKVANKVLRLYVSRAQTKEERAAELKKKFDATRAATHDKAAAAGLNLYIKNLTMRVTDEQLREAFTKFGDVKSCKIMRDAAGTSKGFGFVCYNSSEDATKAVTEMHLKLLDGKPLYVGLAEKKEQREARLRQQYHQAMNQQRPAGPGPAAGPGPIFPAGMNPAMMFGGMPQGPQGRPFGNPLSAMMAGVPGMNSIAAASGMMGFPGRPGMPPMRPGMAPTMTPAGLGLAGMQGMNMQGMAAMMNRPGMQGPGMGGFPAGMGMGMGMAGMAGMARPRGPAGRGIPASAVGLQGANLQAAAMGMKAGPMAKQPAMMGAQPAPGVQFTAQARNMAQAVPVRPAPAPQQQMVAAVPPEVVSIVASDAPLTAAALAAAPPALQKQMLGEKLFPLISRIQPDLAGKITGMMLEMDNAELLVLIESEQQLRAKVDEALEVLRQTDPQE